MPEPVTRRLLGPNPPEPLPMTPAPDYSRDYAADYRLATCKKCFALIVFVPSAKTGKPVPIDRHPLDPRPTEHQRGLLVFDGPDHVRHLTAQTPPQHNQPVYTSHFSTCPFAGSF